MVAASLARGALCALALPRAASQAFQRPPVARDLVENVFLGRDPLAAPPPAEALREPSREDITNVGAADIDCVLAMAPQPVSLYVEVGSFEGGSAILAVRRAALRAESGPPTTTILAVDAFVGDIRTVWEAAPEMRRKLLSADGSVGLLDRFRLNVHRSGHAAVILPLQATSVSALRFLKTLAEKRVAPQPQAIYLDSSHLEGETLLELELAWQALVPGGILFGDDWDFPAVSRDVMRFATVRADELDDSFGPRAQPIRTMARMRHGLFVSYRSHQWFMSKLPSVAQRARALSFQLEAGRPPPMPDCFGGIFSMDDCCDVQRHGPVGNIKCWDLMFSFELCCVGVAV